MDTEGFLAPATVGAASERYGALESTAEILVTELAKEMAMESVTYDELVDEAAEATAQEVLFASLLKIHRGTRSEFEDWCDGRDVAVDELGSEHVEHVVWHEIACEGTVVAATYQDEPAAATEMLRRQAVGRYYRDVV